MWSNYQHSRWNRTAVECSNCNEDAICHAWSQVHQFFSSKLIGGLKASFVVLIEWWMLWGSNQNQAVRCSIKLKWKLWEFTSEPIRQAGELYDRGSNHIKQLTIVTAHNPDRQLGILPIWLPVLLPFWPCIFSQFNCSFSHDRRRHMGSAFRLLSSNICWNLVIRPLPFYILWLKEMVLASFANSSILNEVTSSWAGHLSPHAFDVKTIIVTWARLLTLDCDRGCALLDKKWAESETVT